MKRIVSVWLPRFATDRLRRAVPPSTGTRPSEKPGPGISERALATAAPGRGGLRIAAVDQAARAAGIRPGMSVADARALLPALAVEPADPAADSRALAALADWCSRYTPWTAVDPETSHPGEFGAGAGLWLDVSGCAHLAGGEDLLLHDLVRRIEALGFAVAAASAETAGAAWAVARFAHERIAPERTAGPAGSNRQRITLVAPGQAVAALMPLPVRGLRLLPETTAALHRMGLRRIGDLASLPRAPLAARFGDRLLARLDQALGRLDEPLSPRRPPPAFLSRRAFAEPIGRSEDVAAGLAHLLVDLGARLEAAHQGARRLDLTVYRTDGTTGRIAIGTSRPSRSPHHLERLFREPLSRLDVGFSGSR